MAAKGAPTMRSSLLPQRLSVSRSKVSRPPREDWSLSALTPLSQGLLESPRPLRVLRTLLAAVPLLGAAYPGQQAPAPAPDPVESGAWLKIFGIISGAPDPVVLSEAEVNALLGSAQLAAIFAERAGLTEVQARLLPDEVQLRGRMEVSRLATALGPLAPPPGSPPQPIELVLRLRDIGGAADRHRASGNRLRDGAAAPGHRRSGVGSAFRGLDGPASGREPTQSGRDALSAAAEN